MLEFLFVVGFFVMLMVTGISLIGVLGALVIAAVVMLVGGWLLPPSKCCPGCCWRWLSSGCGVTGSKNRCVITADTTRCDGSSKYRF